MTNNPEVLVTVENQYLAEQSNESEPRFAFSYTITITNNSAEQLQLLSRYWLITDANGEETIVSGEGVIGKQPYIEAHTSFTYSSFCLLKTPVGSMQGHYNMISQTNKTSVVDIPTFGLAKPHSIH